MFRDRNRPKQGMTAANLGFGGPKQLGFGAECAEFRYRNCFGTETVPAPKLSRHRNCFGTETVSVPKQFRTPQEAGGKLPARHDRNSWFARVRLGTRELRLRVAAAGSSVSRIKTKVGLLKETWCNSCEHGVSAKTRPFARPGRPDVTQSNPRIIRPASKCSRGQKYVHTERAQGIQAHLCRPPRIQSCTIPRRRGRRREIVQIPAPPWRAGLCGNANNHATVRVIKTGLGKMKRQCVY